MRRAVGWMEWNGVGKEPHFRSHPSSHPYQPAFNEIKGKARMRNERTTHAFIPLAAVRGG